MTSKHTASPNRTSSAAGDAEGEPTSPVDAFLEVLERALHEKRRDVLGRVRDVELALVSYRRAVEERIVTEFARDHSLRAPGLAGVSVNAAAERLRRAVLALPEIASLEGEQEREDAALSPRAPRKAREAAPAEALAVDASPPHESETPAPLPGLTRLSAKRKLVIVGALAGRQKLGALPASLEGRTEWVDTGSDGAHAIGNLPQRIRQGRVAAVVIFDRAVQHRHTEPLLAAARAVGVPVGFAGKGGLQSIRLALEKIDEQLRAR